MQDLENKVLEVVDNKRDEIVGFLRDIVRIPSETGQEETLMEYLGDRLKRMGFEVDTWRVSEDLLKGHPAFKLIGLRYGERSQLAAVLRGKGGGRSILLNGHIDTVPPGPPEFWKYGPFEGIVERGRLYGRGAADMKGGLTALIWAVECIREAGAQLKGDIILEPVIEEEAGGAGTLACLVRGYRADGAIVAEPTNMKLFTAQAGASWFRIRVSGKATHGCMRNEGVSAAEKAIKIFNSILKFEKERIRRSSHRLYKKYRNPCPINIGVFKAGSWPAIVPDQAVLEGRMGLLPGEKFAQVNKRFERHISTSTKDDPWLKENPPKIEWFAIWEPCEIPLSHPLVGLARRCFRRVLGRECEVSGSTYGADMRILSLYGGIPTIMLGPGDIKHAHFANEFIDLEDLMNATKVFALLILRWCG